MAADGELAREGGGQAWAEGDDEDDVATLFSLELELAAGHRSSSVDRQEEETDKKEEDGDKAIGGREVAVVAVEASRRGDATAEALGTVRPAARLRALVRKLLKPKAAAADEGSRLMASAGEERRTPAEAALMYLSKVPILACRSGMGDGPAGDTSPPSTPTPPPHRPLQVPGRKSRGETLPPPTPPRRDDSLLQAQDGVAGAIAYCKLSLQLASSRGCESQVVPFRG